VSKQVLETATGLPSSGPLTELLASAASSHLYGTVTIDGESTASLVFVDGRLSVASWSEPAPTGPAAGNDRYRLVRMLEALLYNDDNQFELGPVVGVPGAHEITSWEIDDLLVLAQRQLSLRAGPAPAAEPAALPQRPAMAKPANPATAPQPPTPATAPAATAPAPVPLPAPAAQPLTPAPKPAAAEAPTPATEPPRPMATPGTQLDGPPPTPAIPAGQPDGPPPTPTAIPSTEPATPTATPAARPIGPATREPSAEPPPAREAGPVPVAAAARSGSQQPEPAAAAAPAPQRSALLRRDLATGRSPREVLIDAAFKQARVAGQGPGPGQQPPAPAMEPAPIGISGGEAGSAIRRSHHGAEPGTGATGVGVAVPAAVDTSPDTESASPKAPSRRQALRRLIRTLAS
jgi:hypothetical protein